MNERFRLALLREPADLPFGMAVRQPADIAEVGQLLLADEAQEVVLCLHFDQRHRLRGFTEIARGGLAASQVDLRILFGSALLTGAAAIALCHNHPSGDPSPSIDDRALTSRVRRIAELLQIEFLDHVIVSATGFASLRVISP